MYELVHEFTSLNFFLNFNLARIYMRPNRVIEHMPGIVIRP